MRDKGFIMAELKRKKVEKNRFSHLALFFWKRNLISNKKSITRLEKKESFSSI